MAAKTKAAVKAAVKAPAKKNGPPVTEEEVQSGFRITAPSTTEGRLQCIEAMGQRIVSYVQYISKAATLSGTSAEAKEKAVTAFYEQMVAFERQLDRIQDELRLG